MRRIVGDRLDILVANVGVAVSATIEDTTVADFDGLFAVNVRAPFFLVQQLLPILGRGSSVVLLSSLGERGIRVNAVAPGVVETEMSSFTQTEGGRDFTLSLQALKRVA